MDAERYAFRLQIFNELAAVNEDFQLLYFVRRDGCDEIQIHDVKRQRRFLSRTHYPGIALSDFKIGGKVTIYARQYRVVDFDDDYTRSKLGRNMQRVFGLIADASEGSKYLGKLWVAAERAGMIVRGAKMAHLTPEDASKTASMTDADFSTGAVIALSMEAENAHDTFVRVREHLLASGQVEQGVLVGAAAPELDGELIDYFFGRGPSRLPSSSDNVGSFGECACVLVLPTALAKGVGGNVLDELLSNVCFASPTSGPLSVSAVGVYDMERKAAEDFLEVYRLVVPEYLDLVQELCGGPVLALELTGENAVQRIREVCGPRDIELARKVRPDTIRARYGFSNGSPAIHCTDLAEDGPLECEFMFSILEQA